jgi:putative transposase
LQIRCVDDDFTREALALVANKSIGGRRTARELEVLIARRAMSETILSDTELRLPVGPCLDGSIAPA